MGKKDIVTTSYMSQPEYFADAFNFFLFDGKQIVKSDMLSAEDSTELGVIFHNEEITTIEKFRDLLKQCVLMEDNNYTYLILGIENQSDIHYAMPVKNMLYDALNYGKQVSEKAKSHKDAKDIQGAEFLSGFSKSDKLKPVITLVIYFGPQEWDAPRTLKEMFEDINEDILDYVSDYKINLLIPKEITDFSKFKTDLGKAMKYISISDDFEKLDKYITNTPMETINADTALLLRECVGIKIPIKKGGTKMEVCKAWEEQKKRGKLETLFDLVTDNILSLALAAEKASMTEEEFSEAMKKAGY